MPISKEHLEFVVPDMSEGWETPAGYPVGIKQKILAGSLDDIKKSGSRTRLLRFDPGVFTTEPFVHEHWEEVYVLSGDLWVGNDQQGNGGRKCDRILTLADRQELIMVPLSLRAAACFLKSIITIHSQCYVS